MIRGQLAAILICVSAAWSAWGQSLQDIEAAALDGPAEVQFQLGERYRTGNGVLQNYAKAARWYELAAKQGDQSAAHELGKLLISGLGVAQDTEAGVELLAIAVEAGNANAMNDLAQVFLADQENTESAKQAAILLEAATAAGHTDAPVTLALLLQSGRGVEKNIARAIELYHAPAEAGNPIAQNNLGLLYARGETVEQDFTSAREWFERAAESGNPSAMRNLAAIYQNGFGVEVDEDRANELLRAAAAGANVVAFVFDERLKPADPQDLQSYVSGANAGDPIASFYLGYMLVHQPDADARLLRQAARAFDTSARKGIPASMANLGLMMFDGRGVLQDFTEGYAWLTIAASSGLPDVVDMRDGLAASMTIDQINAAQAMAEKLWNEIQGGPE